MGWDGDEISSFIFMVVIVLGTSVQMVLFFTRQKGIREAQRNMLLLGQNRTVPMGSLFLSTEVYERVSQECPPNGDARPNPAYLHQQFSVWKNPLYHAHSS